MGYFRWVIFYPLFSFVHLYHANCKNLTSTLCDISVWILLPVVSQKDIFLMSYFVRSRRVSRIWHIIFLESDVVPFNPITQ